MALSTISTNHLTIRGKAGTSEAPIRVEKGV